MMESEDNSNEFNESEITEHLRLKYLEYLSSRVKEWYELYEQQPIDPEIERLFQ